MKFRMETSCLLCVTTCGVYMLYMYMMSVINKCFNKIIKNKIEYRSKVKVNVINNIKTTVRDIIF